MDFNAEQHKFDWDNLSVGCTQLDHSQNFFGRKHFEHERWDEMEFLQQKMVKTEITEDKENKCLPPTDIQNSINKTTNSLKGEEINNLKIKEKDFVKSDTVVSKDVLYKKDSCSQTTANLAGEWSTKKPKITTSKGAVSKNMPPPPNAYLVKDIYQRKREEAERRRVAEERKMREFHSRPAPSFNNNPFYQKRKPVHAITLPITPQVLKKSREAEEKWRKKLEDLKLRNQPPKFEPRPPTVLKEKPFVPEKKASIVQQHPFNLQMEKRLQERRHYDEIKQKAMEEKRKQVEIEEEERERLEKERIRELRKAANFKARPNPFKN